MKQVELFNDHFQNFKVYGIPKAQLIIADPPYNLGVNAYASNPTGMLTGTIRMGNRTKPERSFSTPTRTFARQSSCTFVHGCWSKNRRKPGKHLA